MYKKRGSRLSAAGSASKKKREYVLEDVFWVPISNCSSGRSTRHFVPELHSEKDSTETSNPDNLANTNGKRLRGHDSF
jgi:hypothetical protein